MSTMEFDTRAATAALRLDYSTRERLESRPAAWWRDVLGVVGFDHPPGGGGRVPIATTMTPKLGGDTGFCEVWRVADAENHDPLNSAQLGRVHYRFSDDLLFG